LAVDFGDENEMHLSRCRRIQIADPDRKHPGWHEEVTGVVEGTKLDPFSLSLKRLACRLFKFHKPDRPARAAHPYRLRKRVSNLVEFHPLGLETLKHLRSRDQHLLAGRRALLNK